MCNFQDVSYIFCFFIILIFSSNWSFSFIYKTIIALFNYFSGFFRGFFEFSAFSSIFIFVFLFCLIFLYDVFSSLSIDVIALLLHSKIFHSNFSRYFLSTIIRNCVVFDFSLYIYGWRGSMFCSRNFPSCGNGFRFEYSVIAIYGKRI